MKKLPNITTGISDTETVNKFMADLKYPLSDALQYLRKYILSVDKNIGECIFYNAPAFFYTGKIKPFEPKEYKRYIVGCNLFKKDTLRIIFLRGANVDDPTGLLEGDYKDGRRIVSFKSIADIKSKETELKNIIKELLESIDK
jgi:hypothetical protein